MQFRKVNIDGKDYCINLAHVVMIKEEVGYYANECHIILTNDAPITTALTMEVVMGMLFGD